MKLTVAPAPLGVLGRAFVALIVVLLVLIWLIGLYAYTTLPDRIPTHFGLSGKPDAFGNRLTFLLLPIAFSLAPLIILLIIKLRFTLINKFPYLVSLPAFSHYVDVRPKPLSTSPPSSDLALPPRIS